MNPDAGPLAPPRDAIAAVTHPDPYPYYARLLAERPFAFAAESAMYVAASAGACEAVLANPACGVRPVAEQVPRALAGGAIAGLWSRWARMSDGARHVSLRSALVPPLSELSLGDTALAVAQAARGLLDGVSHAPRTWLDRFIDELAPRTLARLLGFAADDLPRIADECRSLVRATGANADAAAIARGEAAAGELRRAVRELARRPEPALPGMAHRLLAQFQARQLDEDDSLANAIALLWQSFDAGGAGLGNAIVALARRPELRARVARERQLLPALVAECLRFDPAVHNTRRFVAQPVTLFDLALAPGDTILVLLAAANRDPARFNEPDRLELERDGGATLAFGSGAHHCPGANLAGAIMGAGIAALLDAQVERGFAWDELADVVYRPLPNVRIPAFAAAPPH
jgi:cytochrome P450